MYVQFMSCVYGDGTHNTAPVKITGVASYSLGFKNRVLPDEFSESYDPILNDNKAQQFYFDRGR